MAKPASKIETILPIPRIGAPVLLSTFALNTLALALPLVVLQIFDRVIPFQSSETLLLLFLGLCLVALLEFVLRAARAVLLGSTGKDFETALSQTFMRATVFAEPEAFSRTTPASHLDQFGAIGELRNYYAGQGRILAIDLPFTVVFVAMIGLIGGWLVLVPLGCMIALLTFKIGLRAAQSSIFEMRRTLDSRRYSFLAEALSQIRTLKANTMEPQILRRYELLQAQTTEISHKIIKFAGMSQAFGALFSQFAVAAMGLFGSYLIIEGKIGIAELAACMLLNGRTVQPMLKALGLWVQSENIAAAKQKYELACKIESRPRFPNRAEGLRGELFIADASMKLDQATVPLFENLRMKVDAGQCLLVTGNGGTGKTTFLKILLGEVSPTDGKVLIDGRQARGFISTRGQGGIGYVDHRPVMFAGTVLENISAFGDGDRIAFALELAERLGIDRYINRLPLGYNTQVLTSPTLTNNRAAMQGMSLVRALALRPKLLLVNSIGAVMDDKSKIGFEKYMLEQKGEMTLVLADETPSFAALADHRLILDDPLEDLIEAWEADKHADLELGPKQRAFAEGQAA